MALQRAPIDFVAGQAPGSDALGGAPPLMVNLLRDPATGWARLAPGTSAWSWFPSTIPNASEVIGMCDWDGKIVYVTADRTIWAVTAVGVVQALSGALASTKLQGDQRPVFTKDKSRLYIAGGGLISYWTGVGLAAQVSSGPIATHVVANSQRLVATPYDSSGNIVWTDALEGSHLTGWNELNFAEAEARPDKNRAVHENSNELAVFGAQTLQMFAPDPNVAYSPTSTVNEGCSAPYSIINLLDKKAFVWLNNSKEIVMSSGHEEPVKLLSDSVLQGIETYADCEGTRMRLGTWELWVFKFPTEGRTFVYEVNAKIWFEFRGYSATTGQWAPWPVSSYFYWEDQDVHLVGLETGEIVALDMGASSIAGQLIVGESVTGHQNRGTDQYRKQTQAFTLPLRRGETGTSDEPWIELSYRDENGAWSQPKPIGLGTPGDFKPAVTKRIVGKPYFKRQWRLRVGAGYAVSIGPAEEAFEVLAGG